VYVNGRAHYRTRIFGFTLPKLFQGQLYQPHHSIKTKNAPPGSHILIVVGYVGWGGVPWGYLSCDMVP
jgi:hypothetical protein